MNELEKYIRNKVSESLSIEFKNSAVINKGDVDSITKAVSAMANSDGGKIVFGIRTDTNDCAESLDSGIQKSVEWLDQIIVSNIKPTISNLSIKEFSVSTNKYMIVNVPKSTTAHQAADKRYYKRTNARSVPMEHYEVMDLLNRTKHPKVDPIFRITEFGGNVDLLHLHIQLQNNSSITANNFAIKVEMSPDRLSRVDGLLKTTNQLTNKSIITYRNSADISKPVLFPEDVYDVTNGSRFIWVKNHNSTSWEIHWFVYADNSKPINGTIDLRACL